MNSSAWDRLRDGYYNHKHNDDDKEDMYLEAMGQVVVVTMIVLTMIVAYITTFEGVGFWGVYYLLWLQTVQKIISSFLFCLPHLFLLSVAVVQIDLFPF